MEDSKASQVIWVILTDYCWLDFLVFVISLFFNYGQLDFVRLVYYMSIILHILYLFMVVTSFLSVLVILMPGKTYL